MIYFSLEHQNCIMTCFAWSLLTVIGYSFCCWMQIISGRKSIKGVHKNEKSLWVWRIASITLVVRNKHDFELLSDAFPARKKKTSAWDLQRDKSGLRPHHKHHGDVSATACGSSRKATLFIATKRSRSVERKKKGIEALKIFTVKFTDNYEQETTIWKQFKQNVLLAYYNKSK